MVIVSKIIIPYMAVLLLHLMSTWMSLNSLGNLLCTFCCGFSVRQWAMRKNISVALNILIVAVGSVLLFHNRMLFVVSQKGCSSKCTIKNCNILAKYL